MASLMDVDENGRTVQGLGYPRISVPYNALTDAIICN
jgi:hypothetical protein